MNELKDLIKELKGENDPIFYDCVIAVTKYNGAYLIKSNHSLDDVFDGCDLLDNLTDSRNVPKEAGVYKCKIRYHCYKSHHPLDPVEWDVDVSITSCEQVVI